MRWSFTECLSLISNSQSQAILPILPWDLGLQVYARVRATLSLKKEKSEQASSLLANPVLLDASRLLIWKQPLLSSTFKCECTHLSLPAVTFCRFLLVLHHGWGFESSLILVLTSPETNESGKGRDERRLLPAILSHCASVSVALLPAAPNRLLMMARTVFLLCSAQHPGTWPSSHLSASLPPAP